MEKKEYLTEENYQRGKKKIITIAVIILIVGILIGGSLITVGLVKQSKINSKYSEEAKLIKEKQLKDEKQILNEEFEIEKQKLLANKTTLENKIKPVEEQIKKLEREPFTGFDDAYYDRQDEIESLEKSIETDKKTISVIENALDESFNHCSFSEPKNNVHTSKFCSIKTQLQKKILEITLLDNEFSDFNKESESMENIPFYIFGAFIIIATCMISGSIYMIAKRREILAFTTQQVMPVAQEGIEKMAPTIGNAGGAIAKGIAKGIKDGLKDEEK